MKDIAAVVLIFVCLAMAFPVQTGERIGQFIAALSAAREAGVDVAEIVGAGE